MITFQDTQYEIVKNYRNAFDMEKFEARYSDILARYDYIVGDWSYEQLRLKGFFENKHPKATYDTKIATLEEYLYEYCSFGCAHFVIRKVKG